jgi:hypothetical protein
MLSALTFLFHFTSSFFSSSHGEHVSKQSCSFVLRVVTDHRTPRHVIPEMLDLSNWQETCMFCRTRCAMFPLSQLYNEGERLAHIPGIGTGMLSGETFTTSAFAPYPFQPLSLSPPTPPPPFKNPFHASASGQTPRATFPFPLQ